MMTCPRNAYLTSKLVSGVRGAWLRSFLETICLQDGLLCSSLNTTRGPACQDSTLQPSCPTQSHAVVKKSWKTLSQRASLGLFHFLHRRGGDSCVSLMLGFPPFHCALLVKCPIDMAGVMMPVFPLESTSTETNQYYSL